MINRLINEGLIRQTIHNGKSYYVGTYDYRKDFPEGLPDVVQKA